MHHILSIKVKLHSWTRKTLKSNLSLGFQFYLSLLLALPQLVITLLVSSACLGYLLCILLVAGCSVVSDCFATPWTVACPAPPSMESSRQECWMGCPFLLQGTFLTRGLNLCPLRWQADSVQLSHLGSLCASCVWIAQSCPALATSWTVARRLLCPGILQARILGGLLFPPPGDLPDQEIEPRSPPLQMDSLPSEPAGNFRPRVTHHMLHFTLGLSLPSHLLPSSPFFCSLLLITSKFSFITSVKVTHHQAI